MVTQQQIPGKLGKLAVKHDPRTLRLAKYLDLSALPPIPPSRLWSRVLQIIGLMGNDRIGDCTFATVGHIVQVLTANNGNELTISDADIIAAYSALTGYDPATGANDNGAVVLDVLNYWRKTGVGGHKLGAYAAVDVHNHELVKAAINLFGSVYLGIWLPKSAQNQVGGVWDVPAGGPTGDGAPGSWGGHAVNAPDYVESNPSVITWGIRQAMTWEFWDAYVDECYVCFSSEWLNSNQLSPSGFNQAQLENDLADISGQPEPNPNPVPPSPPTPTPPGPTPPTPTPPAPPASDPKTVALAAVDGIIRSYQAALDKKPGSTSIKNNIIGAQACRKAVNSAKF